MSNTVEINILVKLSEFKYSFDKNKKVSTIKQNKELINLIKEKLDVNSENIKFDFEFSSSYENNQLIGDWINKDKNPKITITLKPKASSTIQSNLQISHVGIEI